ncbi:MAG: class II aldolase/adducin family protein [Desulfopila sp.]|nr:class II aldolase/adducin family protein [Desulfopila sp.]
MEHYSGVKFELRRERESFVADERLSLLNKWAFILAELGLAPVHTEGAYGNHSYRVQGNEFIITRTGMIPCVEMLPENYCLVEYCQNENLFRVKGRHAPSSESFLHSSMYQCFKEIGAIMHGHSALLNSHAEELDIPTTPQELPYGTRELAQAAVRLQEKGVSFFILKNHGFVASGVDIGSTASLVLDRFKSLVGLLQNQAMEKSRR